MQMFSFVLVYHNLDMQQRTSASFLSQSHLFIWILRLSFHGEKTTKIATLFDYSFSSL